MQTSVACDSGMRGNEKDFLFLQREKERERQGEKEKKLLRCIKRERWKLKKFLLLSLFLFFLVNM